MDTNDSLRLASLWHSMHAISQQLSPVNGCAGIELLQADTFDLHCFQSLTGNSYISTILSLSDLFLRSIFFFLRFLSALVFDIFYHVCCVVNCSYKCFIPISLNGTKAYSVATRLQTSILNLSPKSYKNLVHMLERGKM